MNVVTGGVGVAGRVQLCWRVGGGPHAPDLWLMACVARRMVGRVALVDGGPKVPIPILSNPLTVSQTGIFIGKNKNERI